MCVGGGGGGGAVGGESGAMVLGKLSAQGVQLIWIIGSSWEFGSCLNIFSLVYQFSSMSLSLADGPI